MDLRVVEAEVNHLVGGATAVLPTQLGADLQRPMDLGDDIGEQIGEKGAKHRYL